MTHDTALLVWPAVAIAVVALGVGTATLRGGPVGGPAPAGGAGRADRADERPANPPSFAVTLFTIQRDERRPHELREPAHRLSSSSSSSATVREQHQRDRQQASPSATRSGADLRGGPVPRAARQRRGLSRPGNVTAAGPAQPAGGRHP